MQAVSLVFGETGCICLSGRRRLPSQKPHAARMTEPGWTGEQGVRSTFCGNKSVSADNRLQSETFACGVRHPSGKSNRRRPGMTGSFLVSASVDSRPRSESSVPRWTSHSERWKMRTPEVWTTAWTVALGEGFILLFVSCTLTDCIQALDL